MTRKDRVLFTDALLADVGDGDLSPHAKAHIPGGYVLVGVFRTDRRGDGGWWFDVLSRPAITEGKGMSKAIGHTLLLCWVITWVALSLGAAVWAVRWCWVQVAG